MYSVAQTKVSFRNLLQAEMMLGVYTLYHTVQSVLPEKNHWIHYGFHKIHKGGQIQPIRVVHNIADINSSLYVIEM